MMSSYNSQETIVKSSIRRYENDLAEMELELSSVERINLVLTKKIEEVEEKDRKKKEELEAQFEKHERTHLRDMLNIQKDINVELQLQQPGKVKKLKEEKRNLTRRLMSVQLKLSESQAKYEKMQVKMRERKSIDEGIKSTLDCWKQDEKDLVTKGNRLEAKVRSLKKRISETERRTALIEDELARCEAKFNEMDKEENTANYVREKHEVDGNLQIVKQKSQSLTFSNAVRPVENGKHIEKTFWSHLKDSIKLKREAREPVNVNEATAEVCSEIVPEIFIDHGELESLEEERKKDIFKPLKQLLDLAKANLKLVNVNKTLCTETKFQVEQSGALGSYLEQLMEMGTKYRKEAAKRVQKMEMKLKEAEKQTCDIVDINSVTKTSNNEVLLEANLER
ncbi:uncharacterized protein LOC135691564 [Rhopilema esculentum]|uniref:uncharacterized protein LOC135691564 n=1 Tax=Rhopilema esculentum TaxID=499914 RepID=UPI0031D38EEF